MIAGIHHVAISTPDIDRLIRFYTDVIGFAVVHRGDGARAPRRATLYGGEGHGGRGWRC